MYAVKVRMRTDRRWWFLGGDGQLTRLRLRAGTSPERPEAERVAIATLSNNAEDVGATKVVVLQSGRTLAHYGNPTPPKPQPFDFAGNGYRYLVELRRGRGVFHVKDAAGRWANVSYEAYEVCHAEAERFGLDARPLAIHGATCTVSTKGLRFVQESNR
jgi:hypothetical protein